MKAFLSWMQTSKIGIDERDAKNNHGVWFDATNLAIANYVGDDELANKMSAAIDASINQQKFSAGNSSWTSKAFYINYDITETLGLTVREDFFSDRTINPIGVGSVNATTLSGKIKINKITMIPEVRIDRGITPLFSTKTGTATNASNFIVAAIYAF